MKHVILYDTPNFEVISYGNGVAYNFLHKKLWKDVFLQGDDAELFQDEIELKQAKNDYNLTYDEVLTELWSNYEAISSASERTR